MNNLKVTQEMQDEKDSKPEITPELTATSKGITLYGSLETREQIEEAFRSYYEKEFFSNEHGKVYKSMTTSAPEGTAALSIEGQIYYSSLTEVQALQDFLSLRVQKAKEAEIKFKKTFTPIKKSRNKMLHLTPKKKKR